MSASWQSLRQILFKEESKTNLVQSVRKTQTDRRFSERIAST